MFVLEVSGPLFVPRWSHAMFVFSRSPGRGVFGGSRMRYQDRAITKLDYLIMDVLLRAMSS